MSKFVFGITGGSGAGKSTVSDMFRNIGVYVSDADKVARIVVERGSECLEELACSFGKDIIDTEGCLDRKKLAEIVFSDSEKLEKLNSITHKYIYKYIKNELEQCDENICAVDGAVIIGSPVADLCKRIVAVTAKREVRLKRILERDNMTLKTAESRIDAQNSEEFYRDNADYIIENNDGIAKLGEQIEFIYNKIKAEAEAESKKA